MKDIDSLFQKGEDEFRSGIQNGLIKGRCLGTIAGLISSPYLLSSFDDQSLDATFSLMLIIVIGFILLTWMNINTFSRSAIQLQLNLGVKQLQEEGFWVSFMNGFGIMFSLASLLSIVIYRENLMPSSTFAYIWGAVYFIIMVISMYLLFNYPKSE